MTLCFRTKTSQSKDLTEQEIDNELAAIEEVKDLHRDLLRQIDTLKTRHSHYQEALIIQNEFDSFMEVSDPDVPEFEKEVAKVQKRLNLYLQQTISFTEDEELAPLRHKVQSQLSQISKELAKSRKKRIEDRKKSSESDKDKGECITYQECSRFDLDMPTFSGKPLDWRPFYQLFSSTLKSRGKHLNDNEKTCLLLKVMKDEDARQVVLLHSQREGGYVKEVEALINNYGSPAIVFRHHVQRTIVRKTVDFSKDGFTKLHQRFLLPYQAMKEMKLATLSQYLAALAFEDFTPRMREEWTQHIASMSDLPTLEDLFAFLSLRSIRWHVSRHYLSTLLTNHLPLVNLHQPILTSSPSQLPIELSVVCVMSIIAYISALSF